MNSTSLRTRSWTCVALAGLLGGCAAVGPNFKPPEAPKAPGYVMANDDANTGPIQTAVGEKVAAEWWTLFRSPALDQLVREAIANNKTLEQARARLAAAREDVTAQSGLLTIDANAGFQRERANLNAFSGGAFNVKVPGLSFPTNPEFNLYTLGTTVSYNLDLFGAKRRQVEQLKATAESQARELDAAYLTLTGKVVAQALAIADATVELQALDEITRIDQDDLDMIRRAQAAGGATAADIALAESALAEDRVEIPMQRQRLAAARHAMAVLVGKTPESFVAPDFDTAAASLPTTLPVSLPSDLVRQRPDILEAEARLHAATAEIGVTTAALYPNITLSANYALNGLTPETLFDRTSVGWAIGPQLTAPIFHSGELKARQREARENARVALLAYEQTVLEAFNQVADALTAVGHDNTAYADQTRALEAAARRLDMLRRAYDQGGVSAEQVVRAEHDWRRTRLALSQQGVGRYSDAARLLLATASVPPGATSAEAAQHSGQ